ncbi:phytanoyl-CoA dioxygenase family protein [Stenotrophomonas acidaminiphila]|uniref:phytanoyl-CoA dioxygenase family protein n=1 Tax=Stenotrophomonas acidaminiphila TaxID=128780 RepID=UPI001D474467|nr:phytanoyl-CoA dioxygenase family protein [Stenotrophomonas sp.]
MEGLWLDQADAVAQLQGRAAGDVQLEAIGSRMIKDGFVVLPSAIAGTECDTVVSDYQRFIDDLGTEVEQHKDAGGRLLRVVNFHLSSGAAANIGCNPRLMAILDFLLGDEASVYSSLYFEHGSQQPIHRDSPFFETFPRNLFFGVWVALEDISVDAGPLMYVPGGHRFECDPHRIYDAVAACMPAAQRSALINEALEQYYGEVIRASSGVGAPAVVALKKGDVAIWHPQLPHGGSPATDPGLTRRSMVFHCVPSSRQVYQHDVFFAHRGPAPAPRYGFTRVNGRHVALSGATAFQH